MTADPVAWLRQQIQARLALARWTIELGNAAEWTEQSSGVLVTGEPTETDTWAGTWPLGDSTLTRLMEANDPQDTIARCEAELAILDACRQGIRQGRALLAEEVIRLLASSYKHHAGYNEQDWKQ